MRLWRLRRRVFAAGEPTARGGYGAGVGDGVYHEPESSGEFDEAGEGREFDFDAARRDCGGEQSGIVVECAPERLEGVLGVLPALKKPTISALSDPDWVAINTIIEEAVVRQILPKLKAAKAEGIVEYPLNKIVL